MIHKERMTARMDGDFVVFLIGMRINRPWAIHKYLPVLNAMPKMLTELYTKPELGLIHHEMWFSRTIILVQYLRSMEQLMDYAKNKDSAHLPAWQAFNKAVGTDGSVGILKWTPNLGQVFKWDTVQRNGLPMTETKKRRLHPPELKAKLGLEALGGMKTINQIAQEHDVHPMQVRQWKRDIQDQAKTLFEGKRGPQPVSPASSPDRLYGEIGRLKMELDWLKKKSGISLP
jgi:transposase-like protein